MSDSERRTKFGTKAAAVEDETKNNNTNESTPQEDAPPPPLLVSAVHMADKIHAQLRRAQEEQKQKQATSSSQTTTTESVSSSSWKVVPGLVEGIGSGLFMGVLLHLPRKRIPPGSFFSKFDALYTVGQVLISAQVALYVGSISGSYAQLKKFVNVVSPTAHSPIADTICQDPKIRFMTEHQQQQPFEYSWYDPGNWVIAEYQKCLKLCSERNQFREQQQQKQLLLLQKSLEETAATSKKNNNGNDDLPPPNNETKPSQPKSSWLGFSSWWRRNE